MKIGIILVGVFSLLPQLAFALSKPAPFPGVQSFSCKGVKHESREHLTISGLRNNQIPPEPLTEFVTSYHYDMTITNESSNTSIHRDAIGANSLAFALNFPNEKDSQTSEGSMVVLNSGSKSDLYVAQLYFFVPEPIHTSTNVDFICLLSY